MLRNARKTVAVLGLLVGCAEPPPPPPEGARLIKVIDVGGGGATGTIVYQGRIKSANQARLSFPVAGKLQAINANEGDVVEAGTVLARLDSRTQKSELDSALASARQAKAEYDRQLALYGSDAASKQDLDVAQRNYEVQQAKVSATRKAFEDMTVKAPFSGTIGRRLKENYETVQPREDVIVLVSEGALEIEVDVPERDVSAERATLTGEALLRVLSPEVVVSSLPDRTFPAEPKEFAAVADEVTRTFRLTLGFDPGDAQILPGMTARVSLNVGALNEALAGDDTSSSVFIPSHAAVADGDETEHFVWIVDRDTMEVSKRPVELGALDGGSVEVVSGLSRGDVVAISGVKQLREGMKVRRYVPKSERG